jgi:hypothetical protein
MRKIFILFLFFICYKADAQYIRFGRIPANADSVAVRNWLDVTAGGTVYVDSIYKNSTKDSIIYTRNGNRYALKDSIGSGGAVDTSTAVTGVVTDAKYRYKADSLKNKTMYTGSTWLGNVIDTTYLNAVSAVACNPPLLCAVSGKKVFLSADTTRAPAKLSTQFYADSILAASGASYWTRSNGQISPTTSTDSLCIGGYCIYPFTAWGNAIIGDVNEDVTGLILNTDIAASTIRITDAGATAKLGINMNPSVALDVFGSAQISDSLVVINQVVTPTIQIPADSVHLNFDDANGVTWYEWQMATEGTANKARFSPGLLSATRQYDLPDGSGVLALTSASNGILGSMSLADSVSFHGNSNINTVGTLTSGSLAAGFTRVSVPLGGTNLTSVAQGDLLYGSAANTYSLLNKSTVATRFLSNQGASNNPMWSQIDSTDVTNIVSRLTDGYGTTVVNVGGKTWKINADTSILMNKAGAQTVSGDKSFTGTSNFIGTFKLNGTTLSSTATQLNYLSSATGTTGTTSTNVVFSTSPTLVTPTLGAATATTINKVAITEPASGSTLTILNGKTFTVDNTIELLGTDGTRFTFPSTDQNIVGETFAQTLTSKTMSGASNTFTNISQTSSIIGGNWKTTYTNGSGATTELALGSSGKVLTSNGASSAPTWETPAGGSGLTYAQVKSVCYKFK